MLKRLRNTDTIEWRTIRRTFYADAPWRTRRGKFVETEIKEYGPKGTWIQNQSLRGGRLLSCFKLPTW